jgi:hypothetical protein
MRCTSEVPSPIPDQIGVELRGDVAAHDVRRYHAGAELGDRLLSGEVLIYAGGVGWTEEAGGSAPTRWKLPRT